MLPSAAAMLPAVLALAAPPALSPLVAVDLEKRHPAQQVAVGIVRFLVLAPVLALRVWQLFVSSRASPGNSVLHTDLLVQAGCLCPISCDVIFP